MDIHLSVLLWLLSLTSRCNSQYFDNEALTFSLVQYFSIRHVIFLQPTAGTDDYIQAQKTLSRNLLYTSTLSYVDIADIAKRRHVYYLNSLVILHSNDSNFDKSGLIKISNDIDITFFKWLLITDKYDPQEYEKLKISFNCQFVIAEYSEPDEYVLTEIYDTFTVSKIRNYLGKWSAESGLEISALEFYTRRRNLYNMTFNISSNHEDPCSKHSFAQMAGSVLKCIHYRTFPILAQMHNFSINWMVMNRSGGFGPEVLSPDIQFTLFEISVVPDDSIAVMWPTLRTPIEIFTSYTGQGFGWTTFVYPFSTEMWVAIIMWFLVSAAVISATELILLGVKKTQRGKVYLRLWLKYLFSSFAAFCCQSEGGDPDKLSLRILLYLIFLIPAALVPGYSAALTSFLAIKVEKMPFTNLEGLSKAKDYKLGFQATFNLSVFFDEDSDDEVIRAIMRDIKVPQDELLELESEGIKKMCEDKYSFLGSSYSVIAVPPACPYFKLDRPIVNAFSFLPVKFNLPYKNLIDHSLRALLYGQIVAKEARRILPVTMNSDYKIEQHQPEEFSPIMFQDIVTIFIGLGFGIFISLIIFVAEIHFNRAKTKLNRLKLKH